MKTPSDRLASVYSDIPDLEQLAGLETLDTAADLFEASPRQAFTRLEIVRTIRALKAELFDDDVVAAYEIAIQIPIPVEASQPS